MQIYALLSLLLVAPTALAQQQYSLVDAFAGPAFYDAFVWETFSDPTHGRTNYVDIGTAISNNLSYATPSKFVMRADYTHVVPASARGRDSVRITSKTAYTEGLYILDLSHMPTGCATWPAWWTFSRNGPWPSGGEIDIIEGVNQNTANLASLHTAPNCKMSKARQQTGSTVSNDCDTNVNYNQGCGTSFIKANSYGPAFNAQGGGYYVLSRTENEISVWFWSRTDPSVPHEVSQSSQMIRIPSPGPTWGTPDATFPLSNNGGDCDYQSHFDPHHIIFDLTLCGDWAGTAFATSGCGLSSCEDYVNNNPASFVEAYWEINSLRIYTQ
ncbi:glycoside hydrolase family 16 protein [Schizophyllum amplum]|uniref:Glycoside hydrolase family 16 protein n=1 Tax=Schizophyllum amplum TaxID=97359 RepID=A0A550CXS4_9AGAR|nr:glycoside hydrolase family 16 protein [Auriculariopsis ampla]